MIRALSFDADQTLWDFRQVQRRALESTIDLMEAETIIEPGSVSVDALQTLRDTVAEECRGRPHRLEDVREQSFVRLLRQRGHPTPDAMGRRLANHFLRVRFDHIRLYPEVGPVLARLTTRYRLGLLTNGNTYPDRCGLPGVFDAEVHGPSHGFAKPDIAAFEMLAELIGVDLDAIAHIGDDRDDVDGANRAGCISILIDRDGRQPGFAGDAQHVVADLDELESLLAVLGEQPRS